MFSLSTVFSRLGLRLNQTKNESERAKIESFAELHKTASAVLGVRNWILLRRYGKVMDGPHCGLYVSAIPFHEVRTIVAALNGGEVVEIHLMHRHQSGNCESSKLRLVERNFVMVFPDREELA